MENVSSSWQWLNPSHCKRTVKQAGLFLLAYELLKSAVVDGVRDFYTIDFTDGKPTCDPEYEERVLSKSKHVFDASLLWLAEGGVITPAEVTDIQKLRKYRNTVAHEFPKVLFETPGGVDDASIRCAVDYVRRIDRYWGSIAADTDPQFDGVEVDYEEITSLRTIALDYIVHVVFESEEEANPGGEAQHQ